MLINHQKNYGDELPHSDQIIKFMSGDYTLRATMSVIPGFHFVVAILANILQLPPTLSGIRIAVFLLTSLLPLLMFVLHNNNLLKTMQFYFFPPIWFFYFFIYTDLFSALLVMLAYFLITRNKYILSELIISLSIFVRQNNIFWLGYLLIYIIIRELLYNPFVTVKSIINKLPTFILGVMAFGVFILVNGGVVVQDRAQHPYGFYFGNIYMFLFVLFWLLLPVILYRLPKIKTVFENIHTPVFMLVGFIFFLLTFNNTHIYNQYDGYLHNLLLKWGTQSIITKILFFIPVVISSMYLLSLKFDSFPKYFLYPVTLIYLGMSWMVEIRYMILPFIFLMLWRERESTVIEVEQLLYNVFISLIMIAGASVWKIFW